MTENVNSMPDITVGGDETVSMVTDYTTSGLAKLAKDNEVAEILKDDTSAGPSSGGDSNVGGGGSQQSYFPVLPETVSSSYEDIMSSSTLRKRSPFFSRKTRHNESAKALDHDAAIYSSDGGTDGEIEAAAIYAVATKKKKKGGFFSRTFGGKDKGTSGASTVATNDSSGSKKKYRSMDHKYSKKQLRSLAQEADQLDTLGNQSYYAKDFRDAATHFARAYEHKKIIFGEQAVQVGYAVEKLAKAEDMLILDGKTQNAEEDSGKLSGEEDASIDGGPKQVALRYNACTHYRDARYIYQMQGIDTLRILTDMGNFFFREGMDDEALECYDTLTKSTRNYEDSEVIEVSKAYFQMGEIYRGRSQFYDAIVCYENAFYLQRDVLGEVHASNTTFLYHGALAHMEIGEQYLEKKEMDKANESFTISLDYVKKAIAISKSQPMTQSDDDLLDMLHLSLRAYTRLDDSSGVSEATSEIIDELKKVDGDSSDAIEKLLRQRAEFFIKSDDCSSALENLKEALDLMQSKSDFESSAKAYDIYKQITVLYAKNGDTYNAIKYNNLLIPLAKVQDVPLEEIGMIYSDLGRLNVLSGNQEAAAEAYAEAKKSFVRRYGDDNVEVGIISHRLGNIYFDLGYWDECKKCFDQAFAISKEHPDVYYENMDAMLNNMGYFAYSCGEYDKACELYKDALGASLEKVDDSSAAANLVFQNNYANVLMQLGKFEEAVDAYEEVLQAKKLILGASDTALTGLLFNLGSLYLKMNNTSKALEHYEKARAIRMKNLGPEHEDVLTVYSQIGNVYCSMGKYTKAHEIFRNVIRTRHSTLGVHHEKTQFSMANFAFVLYKMNFFDLALSLYQEVLEAAKNGGDLEIQANVYHAIGNIYTKKHEYPNAVRNYYASLERKRQTLKQDNRSVARTLCNLGLIHTRQKLYEEAELRLVEALEIMKNISDPLDPQIGDTMIDLGKVYMKTSKFREAREYFLKSKQLFEDANLPEEHIYVKQVESYLSRIEKYIPHQ